MANHKLWLAVAAHGSEGLTFGHTPFGDVPIQGIWPARLEDKVFKDLDNPLRSRRGGVRPTDVPHYSCENCRLPLLQPTL